MQTSYFRINSTYRLFSNGQCFLQTPRSLKQEALGETPHALLRYLVADVLDGRLSIDARQHQGAEMTERHILKVAERCLFSSPEQFLPKFADSRKVELAKPRLMKRLKKEVIQQESGIEGGIAPVDDFEIDQENIVTPAPACSWGCSRRARWRCGFARNPRSTSQ